METVKFTSNEIARCAEALHNEGVKNGWFQREWKRLSEDSRDRYERLALAVLKEYAGVSDL